MFYFLYWKQTNKKTNRRTNELFLNAKPLWFDTVQLNDPVNLLRITTVTLPLKVAIKVTS